MPENCSGDILCLPAFCVRVLSFASGLPHKILNPYVECSVGAPSCPPMISGLGFSVWDVEEVLGTRVQKCISLSQVLASIDLLDSRSIFLEVSCRRDLEYQS